jgi:hypothetical protein
MSGTSQNPLLCQVSRPPLQLQVPRWSASVCSFSAACDIESRSEACPLHDCGLQMESLQSDKAPTGPLYDLPSWITANYPGMEVRPKR